jgi:hypothetical protein
MRPGLLILSLVQSNYLLRLSSMGRRASMRQPFVTREPRRLTRTAQVDAAVAEVGLPQGINPKSQPGLTGFTRQPLGASNPRFYVGWDSVFPTGCDTTASLGGRGWCDLFGFTEALMIVAGGAGLEHTVGRRALAPSGECSPSRSSDVGGSGHHRNLRPSPGELPFQDG